MPAYTHTHAHARTHTQYLQFACLYLGQGGGKFSLEMLNVNRLLRFEVYAGACPKLGAASKAIHWERRRLRVRPRPRQLTVFFCSRCRGQAWLVATPEAMGWARGAEHAQPSNLGSAAWAA